MIKSLLILCFLYSFSIQAQTKIIYYCVDDTTKLLEGEFSPSSKGYYQIKFFSASEKTFDTLFSALEIKVVENQILYRSLTDTTHQEDILLSITQHNTIEVSYTKHYIELDTLKIRYLDTPDAKCLDNISSTKIRLSNIHLNLCLDGYKKHYFNLGTNDISFDAIFTIGFIPDLGIFSIGYSYIDRYNSIVRVNYEVNNCESLNKMKKLWNKQ